MLLARATDFSQALTLCVWFMRDKMPSLLSVCRLKSSGKDGEVAAEKQLLLCLVPKLSGYGQECSEHRQTAACTPLSAIENLFVPCSANMANGISALTSGGRGTQWIGSTRRVSFPPVRRRRERFTLRILRSPRGLCALHRTAGAAPNYAVCRRNPSHQQTCENPPSHPHRHHMAPPPFALF